MPSSKIRGTGFDVPGDREKRIEAREKKVRKKQVGVVDSTTVLAGFPHISTARCGRVDPLRRLDWRLVHSKQCWALKPHFAFGRLYS